MNLFKLLLAGAATATIVLAFRDRDTGGWLPPGGDPAPGYPEDEEPVLGYDGMDRDTVVDWLRSADLDPDTLARVHAYESAHQRRGLVLETVADLMEE